MYVCVCEVGNVDELLTIIDGDGRMMRGKKARRALIYVYRISQGVDSVSIVCTRYRYFKNNQTYTSFSSAFSQTFKRPN